jgi:hypothetical protein
MYQDEYGEILRREWEWGYYRRPRMLSFSLDIFSGKSLPT